MMGSRSHLGSTPHLWGSFSLVYVDVATSSADTITIPAGALAGDVAILADYATNSTASEPTLVTPTGWTSDGEIGFISATTGSRMDVSHKILVGGDPGASITGMAGTEDEQKIMFVFRPAGGTIATVTGNDYAEEATDANPASQTANASAGAAPIIVIGAGGNRGGAPAFSTASPAFDSTTTVDPGTPALIAGYKVYNSAPLDHDIDVNDLGNNNILVSLYYTIVKA